LFRPTVLLADDDPGIYEPGSTAESAGIGAFRGGTRLASAPAAMSALFRGDLFRFVSGVTLLAVAALTGIPAPTELLWKFSIAATEGGHWLALAALVPAVPRRGQRTLGKLAGLLSLSAAGLFLLPLYHAQQMNRALPSSLESSFGTERRERHRFSEDARPEPFILTDVLTSIRSRPIRMEERSFKRPAVRSSRSMSIAPVTSTVRCPAFS
jgi:hypothetical protein